MRKKNCTAIVTATPQHCEEGVFGEEFLTMWRREFGITTTSPDEKMVLLENFHNQMSGDFPMGGNYFFVSISRYRDIQL